MRKITSVTVATAAGDGLHPRAANPHPTAAPTSGPRTTFCGRTPKSPASKPVAVPIRVGPALVVLPASQPSGAINAPVDRIRYHNGWIPIPRRRARATALAPASSVAPPIVDNATATLFERPANAAPAKPPIRAANTRSLAFGEAKSGDRPADISWSLIRR